MEKSLLIVDEVGPAHPPDMAKQDPRWISSGVPVSLDDVLLVQPQDLTSREGAAYVTGADVSVNGGDHIC